MPVENTKSLVCGNTVFSEKFSFCSYVDESFNDFNYKSLEWVIVRPKFFSLEGGQLIERKFWHDAESEFIKILIKYKIPYELENGSYIIYGYK